MIDPPTIILLAVILIIIVFLIGAIIQVGRDASRTAAVPQRRLDELGREHGPTEPWPDFPDTAPFEGEADIERQIEEMRAAVEDE